MTSPLVGLYDYLLLFPKYHFCLISSFTHPPSFNPIESHVQLRLPRISQPPPYGHALNHNTAASVSLSVLTTTQHTPATERTRRYTASGTASYFCLGRAALFFFFFISTIVRIISTFFPDTIARNPEDRIGSDSRLIFDASFKDCCAVERIWFL